eukprot:gene31132-12782_t
MMAGVAGSGDESLGEGAGACRHGRGPSTTNAATKWTSAAVNAQANGCC